MSARLSLAMSATALVVALLGSTPLGHALASQVPRNSVGPLQIKRNAVGPQKIAPNAVRAGHVLDGSLLAADFKPGQIPQGPKGDKGDKGDKGSPGVSERQVVFSNTASNSTDLKQAFAACPAGKQPLGGGAQVSGFIREVVHHGLGAGGWGALAFEVQPTSNSWTLSVHVICAKMS